jgi:hypothetical protein
MCLKNIWRATPLAATLALTVPAIAEEKDPRPAAGIQDNSFLIEEAYNQEAGVVQHIQTLRRERRDWFYSFTQEWPLGSQAHQFSYTVPYSWLRNDEGQRIRGVGDVMLNYRPQVWHESATMPAFTPRASLILPTGNSNKGTGDGSYGIHFNAAFSKIVSDRVTLHANAGVTRLFDVNGREPTGFGVGGSAIYAVSRDFNLLLEMRGDWEQSVNAERALEREFTFTISPGARYALNFPDLANHQVVTGFATPIMFTREADKPDVGLFFYLSFEHDFKKKKN